VNDIEKIRGDIRERELVLTRHAVQEALADRVTLDEIREALLNGAILEDYPAHQRGPCCLIYGITNDGIDLHIVVTKGKLPVRVITVYKPTPPKWVTPDRRG
jgi:hypothetical protein